MPEIFEKRPVWRRHLPHVIGIEITETFSSTELAEHYFEKLVNSEKTTRL